MLVKKLSDISYFRRGVRGTLQRWPTDVMKVLVFFGGKKCLYMQAGYMTVHIFFVLSIQPKLNTENTRGKNIARFSI